MSEGGSLKQVAHGGIAGANRVALGAAAAAVVSAAESVMCHYVHVAYLHVR